MTASLEVEVELTKLARVLGTDANDLNFLEGADLTVLRELRDSVSDHLLRQGQADFERVGAVARYLPTVVAAKLAEHALGPQLSGRMAGLLSLEQIGEFVDRLPASFLADLAPVVDLRAIGPLISDISEPKLAAAAQVLIERDDWITIAAFIDSTPPERLAGTINEIEGEALLRIGLAMESRSRIDEILGLLEDDKLRELLVAAAERDLAAAAIHMIDAMADEGLIRIGRLLADLSEGQQGTLARELLTDQDFEQAAQRLLAKSPRSVHVAIGRARSELAEEKEDANSSSAPSP